MKVPRKKKPPSPIEARQAKEKESMLRHLAEMPVIEVACRKAGVGRTTYYRWRDKDKTFRLAADAAMHHGRDRVNDMSESVIIKKVGEGDVGAAKYWLSHNHPNYHARSIPPEKPEEIRIIRLDA